MVSVNNYGVNMKRVYLCGPIAGLTYEEARNGWRQEVSGLLAKDIIPLSPMRQEGHLQEVTDPLTAHATDHSDHFFARARSIVAKDRLDVKMSDIILCNLLGAKRVSIGSMIELGWANQQGKPIITVMERVGNPHDHLFVSEVSDFVVDNLSDACIIINGLLSEGL